jgi:hypothetical protein
MFKLLKNKGFSLTEVLVAGFVMSVAGVGMYMGFKSQGDASLFKRRTEKINTLTEDIKQALANNATCVAELGGPIVAYASNTSVNPNPFAGNNIVVNTSLNGAVSTPNLPILTNCNPGVGAVIKSADQLPAPYNGVAINCATMTLGAVNPQNQMARGNITFVFNKGPSGRQVKGGASVVRNIPIIVKLNTANTDIINCSTTFLEETSDEGACEAAGGNWNNDAGLCEMGATNFEEGKFDNDCDDLIGESKNGAGDVSDAINKACRKDEAMCEGVGGCLDWTSPDTGVTTPGCSFPSAGVWSYFGSNPTPYWSACGQKHPNAPASAPTPGACERQRAEECLEGTCGEGCTATGGALWKIDNHDYTITGTALTYGSSPATTARPYNAPVTGAAGTCAVYGQWIDGPAITCQPHPLDITANPGSCYDYNPKVCDDPSSQCMGSAANKCDPLDPVLSTITTTCNNTCGGCGGSWAPLNAIDSMCDPTAAQCTVSLTSTTQWNGGPCNTPPPSTPQNVTASNFWVFSCVGTGNGNETICTHQCEIPTSWGDPWLAGTAPGDCSATCNQVNLVPSILPGCSSGSQITSTPTSSPPAPTGTVSDSACTNGCPSTPSCTNGDPCSGSGDCPGGTCNISPVIGSCGIGYPLSYDDPACPVPDTGEINGIIATAASFPCTSDSTCTVFNAQSSSTTSSGNPCWIIEFDCDIPLPRGSCNGCPTSAPSTGQNFTCNNGTWSGAGASCSPVGTTECTSGPSPTGDLQGDGTVVCCSSAPNTTCDTQTFSCTYKCPKFAMVADQCINACLSCSSDCSTPLLMQDDGGGPGNVVFACDAGKECWCTANTVSSGYVECPRIIGGGSGTGGLADGTKCTNDIVTGSTRRTLYGNKLINSCKDCNNPPAALAEGVCYTSPSGAASPIGAVSLSVCGGTISCNDIGTWCGHYAICY